MKAESHSQNSGSESPSSSGSEESASMQMPGSTGSTPARFLHTSNPSTSCSNGYFNLSRIGEESHINGPQGFQGSHHESNPQLALSGIHNRLTTHNHQHFPHQAHQDSRGYFFSGGSSGYHGMSAHGSNPSHNIHDQYRQPQDESNRKREVRLMKNREAARECRRKKKEYIKCLENRVAVLENQNKALIEELKGLKQLYTDKPMLAKTEQP